MANIKELEQQISNLLQKMTPLAIKPVLSQKEQQEWNLLLRIKQELMETIRIEKEREVIKNKPPERRWTGNKYYEGML
jgi:hypothetical protein